MAYTSLGYLNGLKPRDAELWQAQADYNGDNVNVYIDRANVTAAATSAIWSYKVPFYLVGASSGAVIPYTGVIGAAASDTSSAGTAAVDDATPAVVMGRGEVTLSGDAAAWLAAEAATLTLTYTDLRAGTHTDTFVVTFA